MSNTMSDTAKSKTLRCEHPDCKKKLGLMPFTCRCKKDFCPAHRTAEAHSCTFNYKEDNKNQLLKYMSSPVIAAKVLMI